MRPYAHEALENEEAKEATEEISKEQLIEMQLDEIVRVAHELYSKPIAGPDDYYLE